MVNQLKVQEQRLRFELGKGWRAEKEVCVSPLPSPAASTIRGPSSANSNLPLLVPKTLVRSPSPQPSSVPHGLVQSPGLCCERGSPNPSAGTLLQALLAEHRAEQAGQAAIERQGHELIKGLNDTQAAALARHTERAVRFVPSSPLGPPAVVRHGRRGARVFQHLSLTSSPNITQHNNKNRPSATRRPSRTYAVTPPPPAPARRPPR